MIWIMESSSARKARRREWWKKKKSELRKKRDKTGRSSLRRQTDESKSDSTIGRDSRATEEARTKRGFRSNVGGVVKIEQPCCVKRESSSDSDQLLSLTEPLSRCFEAGLTSDSESESSTESVKLSTVSMKLSYKPLKSEYGSELTIKSTNKQKRDAKTTPPLKSKQKRESMATQAARTSFKKRYILFLGNLPRDASQDDVIDHFSKRGVPITDLRLLTDKESGESKGCAFAEFSSNKAMQNALKFHRSKLQGRTINVEVTCGGGGKGNERLKKIRERNRTLRRTTTVKSGKAVKSKART